MRSTYETFTASLAHEARYRHGDVNWPHISGCKLLLLTLLILPQSIAAADMDHAQLEAFLTAQTRRQGGGVTAEQSGALSRFWKSQQVRIRECLLAQSRWEPGLRGLSWRVDLQTAASQEGAVGSGAVALLELELGRTGQVRPRQYIINTVKT